MLKEWRESILEVVETKLGRELAVSEIELALKLGCFVAMTLRKGGLQ